MTLAELIEKEGVDAIFQKTNVSVENLNFLSEENFSTLNRVRALGFVQIIEREYDIELEELTDEIKSHFEANQLEMGNEVVVLAKDSRDNNGFSFFTWLFLGGLLFAFWYFYTDRNSNNGLDENGTKTVSLTDAEALKTDVSDENANKVKINKDVAKVSKVSNPEVDLTNTEVMPAQPTVKLEEVEVQIETPKVVPTLVVESNVSVKEEEEKKVELIYNLTINPTRGMLWYGFINIDTKERREFMNKVSTPFELNGGRWILVTGHGFVDIVSDVKTLEISDRNKHYFYIDSTDIREITRREFRNMNGRRGW